MASFANGLTSYLQKIPGLNFNPETQPTGGGSVWADLLKNLGQITIPDLNGPQDPIKIPGDPGPGTTVPTGGTVPISSLPGVNINQGVNQKTDPAMFSLLMALAGGAGYFGTPSSSTTNTTGATNTNTTGTTNQNTTGTTTQSGVNTTTPNLSTGQQGLIDSLTRQYGSITSGIPAAMQGIKNTGMQTINRGAQAAQRGLSENLAARGLANSPASGVAIGNQDNQRFASQNQFLQSLPLTQQQMTLNAMGQAGNFALGIPHGQTTTQTGTTDTNQQTTGTTNQSTIGSTTGTSSTEEQKGGGLQGLLGGLATILSEEMYGKYRQPVTYNINNNPSVNAPSQSTTAAGGAGGSGGSGGSSDGGSWLDTLKEIAKKIGGGIKIPGFNEGVEPPQSTEPVTTPPIIAPPANIDFERQHPTPTAPTPPKEQVESNIEYGPVVVPPIIPIPTSPEPQPPVENIPTQNTQEIPPQQTQVDSQIYYPSPPWNGPQGDPGPFPEPQQPTWPTSEEDTSAPGRVVYDPTTGEVHEDSGQPGPNIDYGSLPPATPGEINWEQFDPNYQDPFYQPELTPPNFGGGSMEAPAEQQPWNPFENLQGDPGNWGQQINDPWAAPTQEFGVSSDIWYGDSGGGGGETGYGQSFVSDYDRSTFPGMSYGEILSMKMSAPWAFQDWRG